MKNITLLLITLVLLYSPIQIEAQNRGQQNDEAVDYPEIPRVTAYEAYVKYKQGKVLIFHAGGDVHSRRHVLGSYNLDVKPKEEKDKLLLKFPKRGFDIFIYCY